MHSRIKSALVGVVVLLPLLSVVTAAAAAAWFGRRGQNNKNHQRSSENGNKDMAAMMMRSTTLQALAWRGSPLTWFRLDDYVMGGSSTTTTATDVADVETPGPKLAAGTASSPLHFTGTINTDGGGFCSLRATLSKDWYNNEQKNKPPMVGVRLRYRGDGKTYKFLLSDGVRGRSLTQRPTWQCDLPTKTTSPTTSKVDDDAWQERDIYFTELLPAFGGGPRNQPTAAQKATFAFNASDMREVGVMLSLRLADGSSNPASTFGQGIFSFSLHLASMEPIFGKDQESTEL